MILSETTQTLAKICLYRKEKKEKRTLRKEKIEKRT